MPVPNYSLPLRAFAKSNFNLRSLRAAEKFLVLAGGLARGKTSDEIPVSGIRKAWTKTLLDITYHSSYNTDAQAEGWITPSSYAHITVTDLGYRHLEELCATESAPLEQSSGRLAIYSAGATHSFDKALRQILSSAHNEVRIADSYVDETIFDNLLDQIPPSLPVWIVRGKAQGAYSARVKRYVIQHPQFHSRAHPLLHDRFMIVDGMGYIIGPSLKDAARRSSAVVVTLGSTDTNRLRAFFETLWNEATDEPN